jgi:hypothetical protein
MHEQEQQVMPTCRLACGQHAQCIRVRMHNLQSITETLDMSTVLADLPPERNGSSQLEFRRSHMQEHNFPSDLSFSTLWYRRSRYVFSLLQSASRTHVFVQLYKRIKCNDLLAESSTRLLELHVEGSSTSA